MQPQTTTQLQPETGETRAKLAGAIRDLQAKGDVNTINQLVSAYKSKYQTTPTSSFGDEPTFKASIGGASTIIPNIAKTVGNIPSDVANVAKTAYDTTVGNAIKSAGVASDIYKDRGFVQGSKDIAGGVADTAKAIFKAPGEAIVNTADKADLISKLSPIQEQVLKQRDEITQKIADAKKTGADTTHLIQALKYNKDNLDSINAQIGTKEDRQNSLVDTLTNITKYPIEHPAQVAIAAETLKPETQAGISNTIKPITSKIEEGVNAVKSGANKAIDTATAKIATIKADKATKTALDAITPNTKDLSPSEYSDLLRQQKITPKTAKNPSTYILSDAEKETATRYKDLLQSKDPVENSTNLINEIANKDKQVGTFLSKNNTPIDPADMKSYLAGKMKDITDITVDPARLDANKEKMINNFVDGLKGKDVKNAWMDRKTFDQKIETAFKGSPSLVKDMKKGLRNAVQSYISEKTPDGVYKGYMKDMTDLFNLQDIVATKAIKEKGLNAFQSWIKKNPVKAKIIGYGVGGTVVDKALKMTTGIGI